MAEAGSERQLIRFGEFELDLAAHELRRKGRSVRLQDQPFEILRVLAGQPGKVVSREELRREIWTDDTFVDFDNSLNASVAKLREALGDSASNPRFVQTVPRQGYRFISPVGTAERAASSERVSASTIGRIEPRRWTIALAAAALASTLGVVVAFFAWSGDTAEPTDLSLGVPERLTSYLGVEGDVDFSPDGSQIVFTWNGENQDNYDIYVRGVSGGKPFRLTDHPGLDGSAVWSPDGQWIAFCREHGDGTAGLYRVSPTGGREEKLLEVAGWAGRGAIGWAPDSNKLAIVSFPAGGSITSAIELFELRSGSRTVLASGPALFHPRFSPDGRSLAFHSFRKGCVVLPLTATFEPAGEPEPVNFGRTCVGPAWTPDGSRLIIQAELKKTLPGLWSVRPDGSEPRRLPVQADGPSGRYLLQTAISKRGALAYRQNLTRSAIWRLDLETRVASPLIASSGYNDSALYSPGGSKILFRSTRGPVGTWISDADGKNPSLLVEGGRDASWSPDGTQVVFRALQPGDPTIKSPQDLWVMSAQGGPARQLTRSPEHEAVPVWSRDGKWIYYLSQAEGEIWRIPSAGGIPDLVLKALGAPKEMSADGRWLYVNRGFPRGSVIRLSGDGNEEVLVENVQGMGWWGFGVGASGIYYQAQDRDGGPEIRFYRFSDHSTESVFRLPRRPGPVLDLSPDERYLIFSLDENEQSDLMILKGVH